MQEIATEMCVCVCVCVVKFLQKHIYNDGRKNELRAILRSE